MIIDREQLLTPLIGHLFNGGSGVAAYAPVANNYDLKATTYAGNPAVGDPIHAYFMVVNTTVTNATNGYLFEIIADDDGAGTNSVSLVERTILLAKLTVAAGVQEIGVLAGNALDSGGGNRYLTAKVTTITGGSAPGAGLVRIWLSKASDAAPNNPAVRLS